MTCVVVPWGDGGRSTIHGIVRTVASMLRNDPDSAVASAALSTLCFFDAIVTSRAPPILIPTRGTVDEFAGSNNGLSAAALMQGMDDRKREMRNARENKSKRSEKKSSKKSKRDSARTESWSVDVKPDNKKSDLVEKSLSKKDTKSKESPEAPDYGNNNAKDAKISQMCVKDHSTTKSTEEDAIGNEVNATGAEAEHTDLDVDLPIKEVENDEILIDTSPDKVVGKVEAEEGGVDMKQDDDRDSEDDDSSLNDFPEIVDEDPDEEDRM
jgi:hypothetical protein